MKKYVVGIGAVNVDIYAKSLINIKEHFDHPSIIKTSAGGVVRNIIENISKLGIKTYLLTAVGDDIYGKLILDSCKKEKINTSKIIITKGYSTGLFLQVMNKSNDMHVALCDMTIEKKINKEYIKENFKLINRSSAIILDPSLDNDVINYIKKSFKKIPIFVDLVSDFYAKKYRPLLSNSYFLKPNKTELSALANMKISNKDDLFKAYNKVKNNNVKNLVVSLGKSGCLFLSENNKLEIRKFKEVKKMVNASGAGDSFTACLVYGLINNLPISKTIDYALAAGIATVKCENTINPNLNIKLLNKIIEEYKNEL